MITMCRKEIIVVFLLTVFASTVYAQNSHFETNHNWRFHRKELIVGLGVSQFLGDLGGRDQIGTDYSLSDLEFTLTQPAAQIGFRYRFHRNFATRSTLNVGLLKGDDQLTQEIYRNNRNLSFRSIVVELGQYLEINLYVNEKVGKRNNIRGIKGAKRKADILYIFTGITGFYFNPQGQYNGSWHNLRTMGTEGQGLGNNPGFYSNFNFAIPFGLGYKFAIGSKMRLAIEASYHKTFTDYIDDVSTTYYDNAEIASARGPLAAHFADPSLGDNPSWTNAGEIRGDADNNDAYFFLTLQFIYDFTYTNSRVQWGNGRTSRRRTVKAKF